MANTSVDMLAEMDNKMGDIVDIVQEGAGIPMENGQILSDPTKIKEFYNKTGNKGDEIQEVGKILEDSSESNIEQINTLENVRSSKTILFNLKESQGAPGEMNGKMSPSTSEGGVSAQGGMGSDLSNYVFQNASSVMDLLETIGNPEDAIDYFYKRFGKENGITLDSDNPEKFSNDEDAIKDPIHEFFSTGDPDIKNKVSEFIFDSVISEGSKPQKEDDQMEKADVLSNIVIESNNMIKKLAQTDEEEDKRIQEKADLEEEIESGEKEFEDTLFDKEEKRKAFNLKSFNKTAQNIMNYKGFYITHDPVGKPIGMEWEFVHEDYDGAPDSPSVLSNMRGQGKSLQEVKSKIDELVSESVTANAKPFNLSKHAQHKSLENTILEGPNNKPTKNDAFTNLPISDWHLKERNKGFGLQVGNVWNIDWENIWRETVMDKYYPSQRDKDGNWVGGYIQDRFEVDKNIPAYNNMQLKPGEKRRPTPPEYGVLESRLQSAREGDKPFNWAKEAASKKVNKQAHIFNNNSDLFAIGFEDGELGDFQKQFAKDEDYINGYAEGRKSAKSLPKKQNDNLAKKLPHQDSFEKYNPYNRDLPLNAEASTKPFNLIKESKKKVTLSQENPRPSGENKIKQPQRWCSLCGAKMRNALGNYKTNPNECPSCKAIVTSPLTSDPQMAQTQKGEQQTPFVNKNYIPNNTSVSIQASDGSIFWNGSKFICYANNSKKLFNTYDEAEHFSKIVTANNVIIDDSEEDEVDKPLPENITDEQLEIQQTINELL